jgi:hypothetical protein
MFDVFYSGVKPNLFPHEREANSIEQAQQLSKTRYFWWITYLADYSSWDFLWEPVPWESHQRHAWASQHQQDSGTYLVPTAGYTDTNYHAAPVITRLENLAPWITPDAVDTAQWDYSWHPDPAEPPYVYEFASEWHTEGGPVYTVPGAVDRKYIANIRAKLTPRHDNRWRTIQDCNWDYSWRPHPKDPPYIYVFGNQWWPAEKFPTVEYHVPGATERKFVAHPKAELLTNMMCWNNRSEHRYQFDYSWLPDPGDPPMTYVFGNQWWPAEKMPTVEWAHPDITETSPVKYMSYPRAELLPNTTLWTVPDSVDADQLDFSWVPDPGSPPYIYQFATQHQKTGGPVYTVPGATETKYLEELKIQTTKVATAIIEIDHLDGSAGNIADVTKRVRYFDNYRDTLVRIAKSIGPEHEYIWVCSSICDYTDFDFSWHPEQWQATMLHVFPSNEQKFGDTFFMHVPTFAERAEKKALLEWYDVNYVDTIVPRRRLPVIEHTEDSHVEAVKHTDWAGPLALFTTTGLPITIPTVPLWRTEVKTIMPLSAGASAVIVPKIAKGDIRTQLYDYPYIDKTQRKRHYDQPLDIVFISNGENEAEYLYQHLVNTVGGNALVDGNYRIKRVQNVNGRVAAYHAAAQASTTPWFFAVFAKLQVDHVFDWLWQPDRMQQAKHYIFHALNPVNGLQYGHQAMIAYNKKLVLENTGVGLDFTLDQAHEVVPLRSGTANYYTNNWMCWRTAFRECIKLKASLPDVENEYRLKEWLTKDNTAEQWSMKGAQDAVEFYEAANGNPTELQKSYEWDWLASYAFVKRSLVAN